MWKWRRHQNKPIILTRPALQQQRCRWMTKWLFHLTCLWRTRFCMAAEQMQNWIQNHVTSWPQTAICPDFGRMLLQLLSQVMLHVIIEVERITYLLRKGTEIHNLQLHTSQIVQTSQGHLLQQTKPWMPSLGIDTTCRSKRIFPEGATTTTTTTRHNLGRDMKHSCLVSIRMASMMTPSSMLPRLMGWAILASPTYWRHTVSRLKNATLLGIIGKSHNMVAQGKWNQGATTSTKLASQRRHL